MIERLTPRRPYRVAPPQVRARALYPRGALTALGMWLVLLCAAATALLPVTAAGFSSPFPARFQLDARLTTPPHPLQPLASDAEDPVPAVTAPASLHPLRLGPGDVVTLEVQGAPELRSTLYVADDGSLDAPLAGRIAVAGLSPAAAAQRVAQALKRGQFIVDPQVTLMLTEFRSQQISILGEVRAPGRFALATRSSLLDGVAQAGGFTELGGDTVTVLRREPDAVRRYELALDGGGAGDSAAAFELRSGDTVVVPKGRRFYIYGEVRQPNVYRLERGTTVLQALSRAGGLTDRGSDRRVQLRRAREDGGFDSVHVRPGYLVQDNDVLYVGERWF